MDTTDIASDTYVSMRKFHNRKERTNATDGSFFDRGEGGQHLTEYVGHLSELVAVAGEGGCRQDVRDRAKAIV